MSDRSTVTITVRDPHTATRDAILGAIADAYEIEQDELTILPSSPSCLKVELDEVSYEDRLHYANLLRLDLMDRYPFLSGNVSVLVGSSLGGGPRHIRLELDTIIENYSDDFGNPLIRLDEVKDAYARDTLGELLEAHGF